MAQTPLVMQVGQHGTLRFIPSAAAVDPTTIVGQQWSQQGSPQSVKFTAPDQVQALAIGSGTLKVIVDCGPSSKMPYNFVINVIAAGPPEPGVMPPVAIDVAITPPAP